MRRRQVLAACSALPVALAGCPSRRSSPTDSPATATKQAPFDSCRDSDVSRPEPSAPEWEAAIQPMAYPTAPPTPLDEQSAIEYVQWFEEAYRQNRQIREDRDADSKFVSFSVGTIETWTYDAPPGAAVVRLEHTWSGRFESRSQDGGGHYDSVPHFASYYVDQSMVVRTAVSQYDVSDGDTLSPDPWESGELVACFDTSE